MTTSVITQDTVRGDSRRASPRLSISNLSKRFGSTVALDGVDLSLEPGEIRALVGRNGCGKSTLIKILSGFYVPDGGATVTLDGAELPLPVQSDRARSLGLSFVHQDLGLTPELSVLENVRVGRHQIRSLGRIAWRQERRSVADALSTFGCDVDPDTKVADIGQVDRALIAIVRSFFDLEQFGPGVLILDEPTASLPRDSVDRLFGAVRRVAAEGTAVLFVSHRLDEVIALGDAVSVLRDGRLIGTVRDVDMHESRIIEMILGHSLENFYPLATSSSTEKVVLDARELVGEIIAGVDLRLCAGEVVGVTGINGCGYAELPYLLFGAIRARAGRIEVGGTVRPASMAKPRQAMKDGMALLPADRQRASGVPSFSLAHNISLPTLHRHTRMGRILHHEESTIARALLEQHDVRPPDPNAKLGDLSGGNQQKALLAKWLQVDPTILLLDEPTQGVDVAAKKDIFAQIAATAARGAAVLIASAEYGDLAHICDRIMVLRDGRLAASLAGEDLSEDRIVEQSYKS